MATVSALRSKSDRVNQGPALGASRRAGAAPAKRHTDTAGSAESG